MRRPLLLGLSLVLAAGCGTTAAAHRLQRLEHPDYGPVMQPIPPNAKLWGADAGRGFGGSGNPNVPVVNPTAQAELKRDIDGCGDWVSSQPPKVSSMQQAWTELFDCLQRRGWVERPAS